MTRVVSASSLVRIGLLALAYFAAARLGLLFAIPPGNATSVWPSSGIALAALLLWGYRAWPGIWLGSLLANSQTDASMLVAAAMASGNTLEAVLGAWAVRRWADRSAPCNNVQCVLRWSVIIALACTPAALVGAISLVLSGTMAWSAFPSNALTWWLGDTAGILAVAPLILAWSSKQDALPTTGKKLEAFALLAVVTAVGA